MITAPANRRPQVIGKTDEQGDILFPANGELTPGLIAREIAARLHVSVKTVGTHREHLMQKLGTYSLAGLTKLAIREGVTSTEE